MGILSHSHVGAKPHRLALLTGLGVLLDVAGGLAMAYAAGFSASGTRHNIRAGRGSPRR